MKDEANMRITKTYLGVNDRNCFTFTLMLSNGSLGCGFGGWRLGRAGSDLLRAVLETLEVKYWEELPGSYVRVRFDDHKAVAIGHILKDQWLNIYDWLEDWKSKNGPEVPEDK